MLQMKKLMHRDIQEQGHTASEEQSRDLHLCVLLLVPRLLAIWYTTTQMKGLKIQEENPLPSGI